jgi:magnesium and cobalt transporter
VRPSGVVFGQAIMGDSDSGGPAPGPQPAEADESDSPAFGFLTRMFRRDPADAEAGPSPSKDDLAAQVGASEMLLNLSRMRDLRVDDVSVPRSEIIAVADTASLEEVVAVFQDSTMSRLPVYEENLDHPLGQLHLKDLALRHGFGADAGGFEMRDLLRPLLYAPPSMPIGVLLQKMQAARTHMALVIDEYGGVDGLVTIEDILEQIVGDIDDEHDEIEGELWTCEASGAYIAQARMALEDFETVAGIKLADDEVAEEVDTLGGLVFRLTGRVPERGEVVLHPDGHEFEVLDADARRIKRLRVRLRRPGERPLAAEAAE